VRARRTAGLLVLVLVVAVLLAACDDGGSEGATTTSSRPPRTTSSTAATSTTTLPAIGELPVPEDLAKTVIDSAPAGFDADRENEGLVGPFDAQGLRDALSAPQAAFLVDQGFGRGYGRAWSQPRGDTLAIRTAFVMELRDAAAAQRARDYTDDLFGERDRGTFAVPGIEGAVGRTWVQDFGTNPLTYREVAFTKGRRLYDVQIAEPAPGASVSAILEMARAEAALAR
jgi:hypothetical protein